MKLLFLPLILLFALVLPVHAGGWALGGYDVVAYESGNAVPGRREIVTKWQGKFWHFASERNRNRFEANPRKFIPKFDGLCPVSLSNGLEVMGDPQIFMVINNDLYLLRSGSYLQQLRRSPDEILAKARQQWSAYQRY